MSPVEIGERMLGPDRPTFVIAEAGVNHNGSLDRARKLIDAASEAGADAVKFQTFRADALVSESAPKAAYQHSSADPGETQLEMLKKLELSAEAHVKLFQHAASRGIMFLSSPFDAESGKLLLNLGVAAFKVGSGELTNLPFLAQLARFQKPMLVSTGMSDLEEVRAAVGAIAIAGNADRLVLLHCVSNYPAATENSNLRAMDTLRKEFGVPVGYSDHTLGSAIALAAVALGACVIEKHFTLDRSLPGPDHQASLEPDELASMISGIRAVEGALGDGKKVPAASEVEMRRVVRKSLVAAVPIAKGTRLTEEMITAMRPGDGFPPSALKEVLGKTAAISLGVGEALTKEKIR